MNTWNEAGKGRKQCPTCKLYIGVRASKCKCGFSFAAEKVREKKKKEARAKAKTAEPATTPQPTYEFRNYIIVSTPNGFCPVEIKSSKQKDVKDWATKVVQLHLQKGEKLRLEALKYYVRHNHHIFSDEYRDICKTIDQIKDEVGLYV